MAETNKEAPAHGLTTGETITVPREEMIRLLELCLEDEERPGNRWMASVSAWGGICFVAGSQCWLAVAVRDGMDRWWACVLWPASLLIGILSFFAAGMFVGKAEP